MTESIQRFLRDEAPQPMREAAAPFEDRYRIRFDSLTWFSPVALAALHEAGADETALRRRVQIASEVNRGVLRHFDRLTDIANLAAPSLEERTEYFGALKDVYRGTARGIALGAGTVVVAPERESRTLANALGWLLAGGDLAPHAKRIPYEHGLLIGLSLSRRSFSANRLVFVDGAIASGAPLIALLDVLGRPDVPIDIPSVHAAREGARALLRFSGTRSVGMSARWARHRLVVREVYAVDAPGRLVVGDLGDMIDAVATPAVRG